MAEADPTFATRAAPDGESLDVVHVARSKFIDAFAGLESIVAKAMAGAGKEPKLCASVGQRLGPGQRFWHCVVFATEWFTVGWSRCFAATGKSG